MTKLLNIDANAKTVKGQKQGYMTAVLYLAPFNASGYQVCPMAELAGCVAGCLNTAGRGGIAKGSAVLDNGLPDNAIQRARISRTRFYAEDRAGFMAQLVKEIEAFIRKADKAGLVPVVRLNGTSDIRWERIPTATAGSIFDTFPTVQFYDYTKVLNRRQLPDNYHLSLSYSAASDRYLGMLQSALAESPDLNPVVVFRTKELPATFMGREVVSGDETDLRFTDRKGVVVGLYAKGRARKDTSGFVVDIAA